MFKEAEHENIQHKVRRKERGLGIPAMLSTSPNQLFWEQAIEKKRNIATESCQAACLKDGNKLGIMGWMNAEADVSRNDGRQKLTSTGCGKKKKRTINFPLTTERPLKGQQSQRNGWHEQTLKQLSVNMVSAKARVLSNWDMGWWESRQVSLMQADRPETLHPGTLFRKTYT